MGYKEKYEKALEFATAIYRDGNYTVLKTITTTFPELEDIRNEKIRSALIRLVKQPTEELDESTQEEMLDWLDAQNKKKTDPRYKYFEDLIGADDIHQMSMNDEMVKEAKDKAIAALSKIGVCELLGFEKQCEQDSPVDINKMVDEFAHAKVKGYGVPSMIEVDAYRKGIEDALEKQGERKPVSITDEWIEDYWQHEKVINMDAYDKGEEIQFDHYGFVNFCKKYCKKPVERNEEDEKIRKAILTGLIDCREAPDLGWSDFGGINIDECIAWLEKQSEQKLSDKVEPKFKVDDCIVFDGLILHIDEVVNGYYRTTSIGYGIHNSYDWDIDNIARLWTIADAKDGDILATSTGAFIYNDKRGGIGCPGSHCGINTLGRFQTGAETHWTGKKVYPATKEQRDLLFQKMADAGYEWDSDKKELKKVEPEFHEGDWVVYNNDICQIVKREEGCNKLVTVFGIEKELVNERNLSTARLWTIQDAKAGDVLATSNYIYIFNSIEQKTETVSFYCLMKQSDGHFSFGDCKIHDEILNSIPATKEQRDLLFAKMKEAGYEWNGEKKELNKIKPKTLDADKVIAWLRQHSCAACWDNSDEGVSQRIEQFKKDFEV